MNEIASSSSEQTKILAEVAHDLANRFHRFYYFAEILTRLMPAESGEARDYLDRANHTVEEIEAMTRRALAYLRPMELRTVRVHVRDVVGSLRQHIGDRPLAVTGLEEAVGVPVDVDPTRMGEALANVCAAALAQSPETSPLQVTVRVGAEVLLGFSVRSEAEPQPFEFDLSLALAAKILRLHGGDLDIAASPPVLTVRLLLAGKE
ncbi:MAG TPA: hypothetical protein VEL28_07540 [Candidatus Binatia bacterium]|nr:hypothetical protein [Candidatus Binatia bacterium]